MRGERVGVVRLVIAAGLTRKRLSRDLLMRKSPNWAEDSDRQCCHLCIKVFTNTLSPTSRSLRQCRGRLESTRSQHEQSLATAVAVDVPVAVAVAVPLLRGRADDEKALRYDLTAAFQRCLQPLPLLLLHFHKS